MATRRSILRGGLAAATGMLGPTGRPDDPVTRAPAGAARTSPQPPVLRSKAALAARGLREPGVLATALPIQPNGTTYQMAQSLAWLDSRHFAVGRWDGSMSVFAFNASPSAGPVIDVAVNSPAEQGVQMVARLTGRSLATSNDDRSLVVWTSGPGWRSLRPRIVPYEPRLGVATSAHIVEHSGHRALCVGHTTGWLSIWSVGSGGGIAFRDALDLRNPSPVNPWDLHDIRAVKPFDGGKAVTGSEDGYVCVIDVPAARVLSRTVFNPSAQRGINDLDVQGDDLLVVNCSVGKDDDNLWWFALDRGTWRPALKGRANLLVDERRPQAFAFNVVWAAYPPGRCWFVSTEEGALWMGTADAALDVIGYQAVTSPLGSALGWNTDPGRLALVSYDLYEFTTGI
ncbi:hypothetical protein [Actinomadura fibrosa]|uniref:WD40 repeat domain-containing protein n=1 Tax=Actinomadura fibrosa TaxID=111802 RepID=A0ABW2XIE4_9ACTN|nr:hypothetical protein [Actinomadura fibrosa]